MPSWSPLLTAEEKQIYYIAKNRLMKSIKGYPENKNTEQRKHHSIDST
jgi:hypothetical protein